MNPLYDLNSYNYDLPAENIAQEPADRRDESRLLVMDCHSEELVDRKFHIISTLATCWW